MRCRLLPGVGETSTMGTHPRSSPEEGEPLPCQFAPCNPGRWHSSPTPLVILFLIVLNYFPCVIFTLALGVGGGSIVAISLFHVFLVLSVVSWVHTCATDPGVPPEAFQQTMAAAAASGEPVQICRRSQLYKPPRSHYDSVTRRLTLNMDHFCPWVRPTQPSFASPSPPPHSVYRSTPPPLPPPRPLTPPGAG